MRAIRHLLGSLVPWLAVLAGAAPLRAQTEVVRDLASALPAGQITVYTARRIITMDRANPEAVAVAVSGARIITAGTLEDVKAALGDRPFRLDSTFREKVVLPGLIDQHLHPILGALSLSTEIIAPEDWILPGHAYPAANSALQYRTLLRATHAAQKNPKDWLFSWGYQELWHGKLTRATLDSISPTRPIRYGSARVTSSS